MVPNRPGVKIPFGPPGFKNRPDVEPPGFLRVVAALSIFSVAGTVVNRVSPAVMSVR